MKHIWEQDYPTHNFDIVSPELPSGSGWLVNCLLELEIPIWNPWEIQVENEWQRLSKHVYCYDEPSNIWQQTLPALQHGRVFDFEKKHSGRVTHRWASTVNRGGKLILFVRDPRDMLYSQWRRNKHNQTGFRLSLKSFLCSKYHHYPINFIEYVLMYFLMWKSEINKFDALVVRFEDYKHEPVKTLTGVLSFLDIVRSEQQVVEATKKSDFKVLKEVEENLAANGLLERKFNFASVPFEYHSYMDDELRKLFYYEFNSLGQWLGYEGFDVRGNNKPSKASEQWVETMADCILGGINDREQRIKLGRLIDKTVESIGTTEVSQ